ncbi:MULTISPECIES: hypothetical protein [Uliginosibacterium]|jgi:hypothetical protein|uniref:Lipoprotein n=1 Tax=Uliginosibacterium aquaticum TaxID=2731212 RepID=A0ABX2IIU9_9RHOO|nr:MULTISPECIES: hypothetical protein [Uliginosibacterium]MDO6387367.1 hypothetical protein [Uliginosibacterium sp. 31-12]NSL56417.1 hypothetical protein [Uliginosibacterium aquaticum]PLK47166.1 hypothetical protein C0V76_18190 [Uliginosibacterium sp. TH139]
MKRLSFLLLPAAMLLTGCENNAASYSIDESKNHSISLVREQNLPWFGEVHQRFVIARFPECQRRYDIAATGTGMAKLDLYEVAPRLYAAQQGKAWYALGTEQCVVQTFKPEDRPTSPPGRLVGSFVKKEGALVFEPAVP